MVANLAVKRIQTYNRRTLDSIAARVYFYFSLAYERSNELNTIRATLLGLHRTATLRHDEIGQVGKCSQVYVFCADRVSLL